MRTPGSIFVAVLFGACFLLPVTVAAQSSRPPAAPYNPLRAEHDIEVGKFYMKNGDVAGAIARFQDAIACRPHFAEPRLLLAKAYERRNDPGRAIHYYREYLKILPESPETGKICKRIAALEKKLPKRNSAKGAGQSKRSKNLIARP